MDPWRHAAAALVADLRQIFAGRLRAVVAYGPHLDGDPAAPVTSLVLVEPLELSDLEACARLRAQWRRHQLATPLVLTETEFRRSLDAFPLEYGEMLRAHERLFGADPFDGVTIAHDDLRRACEAQAKSHLLHLREGFIESAGRPQAIAELVAASAPAFASLLRNVARLHGPPSPGRAEATHEGARVAALSRGIVNDVLALEHGSAMPATDAARLFPEYLAAVERVARVVDGWRE